MQADYLIIGQGISGTFLSWYLEKAGASVVVIDEGKSNSASRVAAGLVNPVTGRRLVTSWMIEELMPFTWQAYKQIGAELQRHYIRDLKLVHFFSAPDMENAFTKKLSEAAPFIEAANGHDWRQYFNYPFGYGVIKPIYVANIVALTADYAVKLSQRGQLRQERFEPDLLDLHENGISYRDIRARKIIFCDGPAGLNNPWFGKLPYSLNKGEALLVEIPDLPTETIYKFGQMLIPVDPKSSIFWYGSNYEWKFENELPTERFRQQGEAELKRFLKLPFTIRDHKAGVRPSNIERRPFAGLHPRFPQIGILNGMGTKGCSLAPYFAAMLADSLVSGGKLIPEASVNRFERILAD